MLSINRGFSAPVVVETDRMPRISPSFGDDDDPFARFEAMQQLMVDSLLAGHHGPPGRTPRR